MTKYYLRNLQRSVSKTNFMTKENKKRLCKMYTHQLKSAFKASLIHNDSYETALNFFMTYIRFLRDKVTISEPLKTGSDLNLKLESLCTAISSYEKYCETKNKLSELSLQTNLSTSEKEVLVNQMNTLLDKYWKNLWSTIVVCMEGWTNI